MLTWSDPNFKMQMGSFATGRRVQKKVEGFELQEPQSPYNALFDTEKNDIEDENLPQPLCLRDVHATELLFPAIKRLLRAVVLAAYICHRKPGVCLL
jgi:hypothetical protein